MLSNEDGTIDAETPLEQFTREFKDGRDKMKAAQDSLHALTCFLHRQGGGTPLKGLKFTLLALDSLKLEKNLLEVAKRWLDAAQLEE